MQIQIVNCKIVLQTICLNWKMMRIGSYKKQEVKKAKSYRLVFEGITYQKIKQESREKRYEYLINCSKD